MKRVLIKILSRIFLIFAWFVPFSAGRKFFHKLRGVKIAPGVEIGYFVIIDHNYPDYITINQNCVIAAKSTILAHDDGKKEYSQIKKTIIGKNCFLGINSVILPGVKIGNNSIIGANTVVNKNIPKNSLAVGTPAKIIKKYSTFKNNLQSHKNFN